MARKGLFSRVQPTAGPVTADLVSRLQDNIRDAVETLAKDHDVWSAPTTSMLVTGNIPAGASIVTFSGKPGQTLTLPPANAQGGNAGASLCIINLSTVAAVTIATSRGDTINGSTSATLGKGAMFVLASDGVSVWQAAPSTFSGRLLRAQQVLVSGTTITHPTGTALIKVRVIGAGGGGGGVAASAAGQSSLGAGGGGGGYAERTYVASSLTSTYVIGTGGTAGASGGGAGGNGGDTTFTHGGATVTAGGGVGGGFSASAATAAFVLGGAGGTSNLGNLNFAGENGGTAMRPDAASPTVALSGAGGDAPLAGGGGASLIAGGTGSTPSGAGAGGGGALSLNASAARAGGAGNDGTIIVEEYS